MPRQHSRSEDERGRVGRGGETGKLLLGGFLGASIVAAYCLLALLLNALWWIVQTVSAHSALPAFQARQVDALRTSLNWLAFPVIIGSTATVMVVLSLYSRNMRITSLRYNAIEPCVVVALTAFNDESSVSRSVRDFGAQRGVIEVIVVDNNSSDQTAARAASAGARVVRERMQGYGFACARGLREALLNPHANVVVLAEGDETYRGYDLPKLLAYLVNTDMVVGNRITEELVDPCSQMDWFLLWGNYFLAKLIQLKHWNFRFGGRVRLTDVGCTLRAIRREALQKIVDELSVGGMHFSPHMIMVALRGGLKVIEIPVSFHPRTGLSKGAGGSRWRAVGIGLKMLWHILTF